jgi:hypothetical protein
LPLRPSVRWNRGQTEATALIDRRRQADAAAASVLARLGQSQAGVIAHARLDRIETTYRLLLSQRSELDREVRRPASLHSLHAALSAFETPTALIWAMQELLGSIHVELASADHGIAGWLEVQRLSLEMAEHAGRERAQIGGLRAGRTTATDECRLQSPSSRCRLAPAPVGADGPHTAAAPERANATSARKILYRA